MSGSTFVLPIGSVGTPTGSGVSTYSGLVTSIGQWLNRADLGPYIPSFILMVEERINRLVRAPDMELVADLITVASEGTVDLPADFLEARALYLTTDPKQPLEQVTPHQLRHLWAASSTGKPLNYAIVGGTIQLGPTPDAAYDMVLTYWQKLPALSTDNETNWVIDSHPSYYLYGSLVQAELFGWNDERLPMLKSAWDEVIGELNEFSMRKKNSAGPLRMRAPVRE